MIVTSPPYDTLRDYGGYGFDFETISAGCVSALKEGGVLVWIVADAIVNGSQTGTSLKQALHFKDALGLRLHDTMIYQKQGGLALSENRYLRSFQYMFILSKGKPKTANMLCDRPNQNVGVRNIRGGMGRRPNGKRDVLRGTRVIAERGRRTDIWQVNAGTFTNGVGGNNYQHPAVFPYALARDHILSWSNPGDMVLDPMAGSGTTLRAAVDYGRRAIGIEIHEPYLALIRQKMAQQVLSLEG